MNNLDHLLRRNKEFAVQQSAAGTLMPSLPRAMPKVKAVIIGCADMRVDPAHVLGIKPGEAVVMRNIGGRITPGLLEQLGLLGVEGSWRSPLRPEARQWPSDDCQLFVNSVLDFLTRCRLLVTYMIATWKFLDLQHLHKTGEITFD
jgi:hypothetical protein